ncbi:hypothetical protein ACH5RR_003292 [Cinchona calisaya]|uniref:Retrovirus-related Pol polyprotein from transposon TNT 1-94-like beta-barrel domain-containing protein n=1 Tax=Cinchona calisaya TaxID=153742 RepID=A0ABD3AUR4_9GENT
MSLNSTLFNTKRPISHSSPVHTANNSSLHINHIGSTTTSDINIPDTYYVPNLSFNLLYVGQFCDLDFNLNFLKNDCIVQDLHTSKQIRTGCKVGRLFELTSLHFPLRTSVVAHNKHSTSLQIYHSHLGYALLSLVRQLMSSDLLDYVRHE